ncbi:hypothetical protein CVT25_007135 [Psilocybe cyanescens]|uniref:Restriction endonuclease type IV Mrr domain-containing protein n=1 Tax=Psilocybe cyanescens TaxID=93625 RepID=A0A409WVP3_PSICY|nr:hypothetical protein CVT25_007135 [Psilocybe cyanescens]
MSAVHKGNAFEERSLKLLEQTMSMSLKRVGGKEDGGIDLVGWWWLPNDGDATDPTPSTQTRRIRILGQCKAEKKKMGPGYVRELEGVLYRFMTMPSTILSHGEETESSILGQSQIPMVALLISESPFTKSALLRAHSSPIPFLLLHLPRLEDHPISDADSEDSVDSPKPLGNLGAALCNPALSGAQGLFLGQMEVRWERHMLGQHGRPALWWRNQRLPSQIPNMDLHETRVDASGSES